MYLFWFIFYILLFEWILSFVTWRIWPLQLYWAIRDNPAILILFAIILTCLILICPLLEPLWRIINGVRPLRLNTEKNRLEPLFKAVYKEARKKNGKLYRGINLYIQEDMEINAFAFGRETLILTKGSTMLLSDEDIKGLIAHELGHFANGDTIVALAIAICFLPVSLIKMFFARTKQKIDEASKKSFFLWVFKGFYDIFYHLFKGIYFVSELIIMHQRRGNEYRADVCAFRYGYGEELAGVLNHLYEISLNKSGTVMEMMRATHPHITKRIERLETDLNLRSNQD